MRSRRPQLDRFSLKPCRQLRLQAQRVVFLCPSNHQRGKDNGQQQRRLPQKNRLQRDNPTDGGVAHGGLIDY